MKRGWLSLFALLLLLAMYAGTVVAQNGTNGDNTTETAQAATDPIKPGSGGMQTSAKFGFNIALPSGGTTLSPETEGWPWPNQTSAAFHWYGPGAVKEVIVHCHEFQSPVSQATFNEFKTALQQNFTILDRAREEEKAKDKTAQLKDAMGVKEKKSFILGDPGTGGINTAIDAADGSRWNLLAVTDQRNESTPISYSILTTFGANRIYSVTLIYNGNLTQEIKDTGGSIINSLSDPTVSGPFGMEFIPNTSGV
jgi:hypothetical protein